ncbi:DUF397 domain-containing protein [Streptomyces sp. NPDC055189]
MTSTLNALDLAPRGSWFKSSYSDAGNNCIEVASLPSAIAVRDSKEKNGPAFAVSPRAFAAFVACASAGTLTG